METLNHIIIYNGVFSLLNSCICNPCNMTSNVHMAINVTFQLEPHLQQTFPLLCLEPYKHPKTTKLNPNTPSMKQYYKKITNIDYYFFLLSMKHSRFMEI
jgi:hypothetical protein